MDIQEQYPLSKLTTFRIGGPADYFAAAGSLDELKQALVFASGKQAPVLILGHGSNMLVSDSGFRGLVIQMNFKGLDFQDLNEHTVEVKAAAGENWDDVVRISIERGLWGIENLSGIPGSTGAFPVQNVGAYGQEASEVVAAVEAFDLQKMETAVFDVGKCGFGYRRSRFNTDWKGRYVILAVSLWLHKRPRPNLDYVDVKNYFANQTAQPSGPEIRDAILEIRERKFPDLAEMGTAGSFFKNLILSEEQYEGLAAYVNKNFSPEALSRLEAIRNKFPIKEGIKIPAAFLIDICGLKGQSQGGAQLWEKQALVIVNTGSAKALDVAALFRRVRQEVYAKTGMELVSEPEWVGFSDEELKEYYKL